MTILSGGPGTGKTYTLKVIVEAISKLYPSAKIQFGVPTALAARCIAYMTGRGDAVTIHSLLELPPGNDEDPHVKPGELSCDYLIIDEFSMVDMKLCRHLFVSAASGARIIIVGDHNQLPSVGAGLVLHDLIGSGIFPTVTLTKVFRQDEQNRILKNTSNIIAPAAHPGKWKIQHNSPHGIYPSSSPALISRKMETMRLLPPVCMSCLVRTR